MVPKSVYSSSAPSPQGPYSQALVHNGLVYCSGQIPLDPATGKLVDGPIGIQTRRALMNLEAVLREAGSDSSLVLRTTVYLAEMDDFPEMNAAYASHFGTSKPARSTLQAARLPLEARIEIECLAALPSTQST
jgi:2-iminobutanoate/2-iminopropanoate deaminase